jgi:hypothetical protein
MFYTQTIFTKKGKRGVKDPVKMDELPSIIPDDEVICAVVYVCYGCLGLKSNQTEDLFAIDGYNAYDEKVQAMRAEGWELVKEMHANWDKERTLQSARKLGARL